MDFFFGNIIAAVTAFAVTAGLGAVLIPWLKKLKFGQMIREDGPTWHQAKQGTPTMGGIMFAVGITVAIFVGYGSIAMSGFALPTEEFWRFLSGVVMAVLFASIGFLDDYIKVVKKRNLGLKAGEKIILQILVASAYLAAIYFLGGKSTIVNIPFLGGIDFGLFYFPVMGILIIGMVNSVNLADGIDGLCTTVTFIVAIFFLSVSFRDGGQGLGVMASAMAAGCIGFLIYNLHPAKVFMGDTGSFFFGGLVTAMGFALHMEFLLLVAGFIYCGESLSVILQVISCKTRGKRLFKMSPIHHHFEMSGWKENKIVGVFSFVTAVTCIIAYFLEKTM